MQVRSLPYLLSPSKETVRISNTVICRLRGAMVARLTPDQKAACSSHVGVRFFSLSFW